VTITAPEPRLDDAVSPRHRRADAVRNHDALVQAAVIAFAERGSDVPLEDIAAAAGVGIGTLYRNFPSREALAVAAYREGVEQLCEAAETLLSQDHEPDVALQLWLVRFIGYLATKRGLVGILKAASDDNNELFVLVRKRMIDSVTMLLDAAAGAGRIRADLPAEDLMRALGGICMATDNPAGEDQARRLLDLLMDGLRFGALAAPAAG
jgi:AcrR family transcriptional regulator